MTKVYCMKEIVEMLCCLEESNECDKETSKNVLEFLKRLYSRYPSASKFPVPQITSAQNNSVDIRIKGLDFDVLVNISASPSEIAEITGENSRGEFTETRINLNHIDFKILERLVT